MIQIIIMYGYCLKKLLTEEVEKFVPKKCIN